MHGAETVAGEVQQVGGLDKPLAAALGADGVALPAGVGVALEGLETGLESRRAEGVSVLHGTPSSEDGGIVLRP